MVFVFGFVGWMRERKKAIMTGGARFFSETRGKTSPPNQIGLRRRREICGTHRVSYGVKVSDLCWCSITCGASVDSIDDMVDSLLRGKCYAKFYYPNSTH